ncbi:hypothetical protein GCM10010149_86340 [Nonomuraea roseoviolacea subsp. roseoviolacea]|uniref:hypothetical protein n=1 Tax=Nonomuraea roseoviolacea TaxID=103837 RepID=UPI0031DC931F
MPANGSNDAFGALGQNGALNGLTAGAVSRVSFTEGKLKNAGKGLDQQKDTLQALDDRDSGLEVPYPHFAVVGMGVNSLHEKAIEKHREAAKLAQASLDSYKQALHDSDTNYTGAGSDTMQQVKNGLGDLGGLGDMGGLKTPPGPGGLPDFGGKGLPDLGGKGLPDLNGDGIPDIDRNGDGIPDVDVNGDGIPDKDLNGDGIPDVDLNGDGKPDLPKTDLPKQDIPKMPSTDLPKMPSTDLPKMPSADLPNGLGGVNTKVPDIESALNGQRMPDMSGINAKVPTGTELSDYQQPQMRTPDMSALNADPNSVARSVNPVQTSTSPNTGGGTFSGGGANAGALQAGLRSATAGLSGSGMPMMPMMPMSPQPGQDQSGDGDDKYGLRAEESVWGGDDPTAPSTIGVDV